MTFTLSVNGESTDFTVPVVIPWDEARVKAEMENKITSKIVLPDTDVTEDLSLSKVIGDNKVGAHLLDEHKHQGNFDQQ